MAITMTPYERIRDEIRYCEERLRYAKSRDEHDYYRDRLHELERRFHMNGFNYVVDRMPPQTLPLPATPPTPTALTFLEKADKKLLLTGTPT